MKQGETPSIVQGNGQEPSEARRHYSRGIALFKLGRFEEALPEVEEALELDPENERYRLVKVAVLIGLERFEEAENELRFLSPGRQVSPLIGGAKPMDGFDGMTGRVKPIVDELGMQLIRALRTTWVLLVKVSGVLRVLINRLVVRARVFLGAVRDRLLRVINCTVGGKSSPCDDGN